MCRADGRWAVVNTRRFAPAARLPSSVSVASDWHQSSARSPLARARSSPSICRRKARLAKSLGATHTFNAGAADCAEQARAATHGGVDTAIEMAGSTVRSTSPTRSARRGTTVTAGLPPPNATWPMPPVNLVAEERTIRGSYIGTCVPLRDVPRFVDLFRSAGLPVDRLMTGTLPLDEINRGFDQLHEGKAVRQSSSLAGTRMAQFNKTTPNDWLDQTSKLMKSWNEQVKACSRRGAEGMTESSAREFPADRCTADSMQVR